MVGSAFTIPSTSAAGSPVTGRPAAGRGLLPGSGAYECPERDLPGEILARRGTAVEVVPEAAAGRGSLGRLAQVGVTRRRPDEHGLGG